MTSTSTSTSTDLSLLLDQMDALMERCRRRDQECAARIARMRATIDQAEARMARFDQSHL